MKKNERLQALEILNKLLENNTPLSHLIKSHDVTPLCQEICFGVCRHFYQLQLLTEQLVKKRPKDQQVWLTILIGLYQLHFLRIPDYAVVKETVSLLDKIKKPWAKALVNGVLRSYCRRQDELLTTLQQDPHFTQNHPEWFINRLRTDWPTSWESILTANDKRPPMTLRNNKSSAERDVYLQRLKLASMEANPHSFATQAIELAHPVPVQELPGFDQGDISVQDAAAQLAVCLLELKPKLRILDACCAPGGKTGHILESEPSSILTGLDVDAKRLQRVRENLDRLGLQAELKAADALEPNSWWDGVSFDRILLDAPCSATGVIRRHPDIKLLRTEDEITKIAQVQYALLKQLWPLLGPTGILVYATCSVMKEENEIQMQRFFREHEDAQFIPQPYPWGEMTGHGWQILPGTANMDGFFYSVIHRSP